MEPLDRWLDRLDPSQILLEEEWIDRPFWEMPQRVVRMMKARRRIRAVAIGAPGSGKTTELARWPKLLAASAQVMTVDLGGTSDLPLQESLARALGGRRQEQLREVLSDWTRDKPLLLVIDGFDQAMNPEILFGPHAPWFDPILPSLLVLAPARTATWGRERWDPRFDWISHFPPFPVLRPDGNANSGMLRRIAAGIQQRLPGLTSPKLLQRIAASSGGLPRDLLRLLRDALISGRFNQKSVERAEQELREELLAGLSPEQAEHLRRVRETRHFYGDPLLVERGLALRYAGEGGGWWAVHPLLPTS